MESIYPKLALCGSKNECARTDTVFFPISEFSKGTVSLNDGGVCRTAPATPGLLKTTLYINLKSCGGNHGAGQLNQHIGLIFCGALHCSGIS